MNTPASAVNVFVAETGNEFMRDIATWLVAAARELGRASTLVTDRLPADDGSVNLVVAPHEFYLLRDDSHRAVRSAARHSVPICTEQPGTPWFHLGTGFCVGSPVVADINAAGAEALTVRGFDTHRLLLGGVEAIDCSDPEAEHDIDVLFLGGSTPRRAAALASLAPSLWRMNSEIRLFSFTRPLRGDEPGVVFGRAKYELLARSKVLINLHRSDDSDGYFEWARMVEAMANRCVVVTEPSVGHEPLVRGEHFVETSIDRMADVVSELVHDRSRRRDIAEAAHCAVMSSIPLSASLDELLRRVEAASAGRHRLSVRDRWEAAHRIERVHRGPVLAPFTPHGPLRRRIYDGLLAEMHHRRELGRLRCLVEHGTDDHVVRRRSDGYDGASPDVSVIVTVYNYADVVRDTLDSIVASEDVQIEIVVVDDASTDGSRPVVEAFVDEHPDIPILLLGSDVNRGLPVARNLAIAATRAEKVMVMDADNLVYPNCLRRLSDALDEDPGAAFAYSTLEAFGTEPGLRSERGWHVPWLCDANYIDAQAMLRRSTWERHGGYRADDAIHGWEDWDLWLRLAVVGERGVHVPQMLGRYRTQSSSMISITNLVAGELRQGLVERYPTLPWPELAGAEDRHP